MRRRDAQRASRAPGIMKGGWGPCLMCESGRSVMRAHELSMYIHAAAAARAALSNSRDFRDPGRLYFAPSSSVHDHPPHIKSAARAPRPRGVMFHSYEWNITVYRRTMYFGYYCERQTND